MNFRAEESNRTIESHNQTNKPITFGHGPSSRSENPNSVYYGNNEGITSFKTFVARENEKIYNSIGHNEEQQLQDIKSSSLSANPVIESSYYRWQKLPRKSTTIESLEAQMIKHGSQCSPRNQNMMQSGSRLTQGYINSGWDQDQKLTMTIPNRFVETQEIGTVDLNEHNKLQSVRHSISNRSVPSEHFTLINGTDTTSTNKNDRNQAFLNGFACDKNVYPTYTNATGSLCFMKVKETSQQEASLGQFETDTEHQNNERERLESDLLVSTPKDHGTSLELGNRGSVFKEPAPQQRPVPPNVYRDNGFANLTQQIKGFFHNQLQTVKNDILDQKTTANTPKSDRHEATNFNSFEYESIDKRLPRYIENITNNLQQETEAKDMIEDDNGLPNNCRNINIIEEKSFTKKPSKIIEKETRDRISASRLHVATQQADLRGVDDDNSKAIALDYKTLYDKAKHETATLETNLASTSEQVKQLQMEKATLIKNYEKLIQKLRAAKDVEGSYTKAAIERSKLTEEVNKLEERVSRVKEGSTSGNMIEDLTLLFSKAHKDDKEVNTKSAIQNNCRNSVCIQPVQSLDNFEAGKYNVVNSQQRSFNTNNRHPKEGDCAVSNSIQISDQVTPKKEANQRSKSVYDNMQTPKRICKSLNEYINTLESNVCEVVVNGQVVYNKNNKMEQTRGSSKKENEMHK